jgi:hypothetical protein
MATATPARMTVPTMPRSAPKYPTKIAPTYLADLRRRVEHAGVVAVARAAKMSRQTCWRALGNEDGRRPSVDAIERIRRALAKVAPDAAPPPPIVAVRSAAHHAWIALADRLEPAELARVAADPRAVIAAAKRPTRRK